ncbi:hypothetical protein SUGI_1342690 [Cryptomeria japonica]|uniref:Pre-nudix hydrolase domain-containing protein n=1 Tax=Cryptomeria japonica TaxID=3369 RepID=A0AAD3NRQ5_CRYJA|nr:hypothetical protein SUGI_1342690 [Cryptomeria japonica]
MQNDASRFAASLKASLSQWARQGKKAVWIKVPKEQAKLVPVAIEVGFGYHHAEPSYVMLVHWIPQTPPTISDNASHQAGVVAFVFNEEGEVKMDGHNTPFGKSDLLFVCMLRSLSSNIVVQDTKISAAKWMAMEEFANVNGQCEGFSGIGTSSNSRKPSAFFCTALNYRHFRTKEQR